jgi:hypothetical protein
MDEEHLRKPLSTSDIVEATKEDDSDWLEMEEATGSKAVESQPVSLLRKEEIDELRSRWNAIQIEFVDEPRASVEQADALVAEVMKRIAQMFSEKRAALDEQWTNHDDVSTEDLRVALQRYRSFFQRLLSL